MPHTQFLSNGKYAAAVTNAGGGASFCDRMAVTRSRRDSTTDPGSNFIYLRDIRSGEVWSPTYLPTRREPERYLATFQPEIAVFDSKAEEIATKLEIAVSPEHDVEVRLLHLVNHGDRVREIDVTSYVEIALAQARDDFAHPAFGKLFIETEYLPERAALICHRRPRDSRDPGTWAVHVLGLDGRAARSDRVGNRSRAVPRPRPHARSAAWRSTAGRCPARPASSSIRSSACGSASGCRPVNRSASVSRPVSRPIARPRARWR